MKLSMLRIGIFLVVLGLGSYGYSLSMDLFSDKSEFMRKMDQLPEDDIDRAYYQLREEYITDQPIYTDVGIICVSLGMFILIFLPKGLNSKTPRNKYYSYWSSECIVHLCSVCFGNCFLRIKMDCSSLG